MSEQIPPYAVFCGERYYPGGGWGDFSKSFSSKEDAIKHAISTKSDWWEVVDLRLGELLTDNSSYKP